MNFKQNSFLYPPPLSESPGPTSSQCYDIAICFRCVQMFQFVRTMGNFSFEFDDEVGPELHQQATKKHKRAFKCHVLISALSSYAHTRFKKNIVFASPDSDSKCSLNACLLA